MSGTWSGQGLRHGLDNKSIESSGCDINILFLSLPRLYHNGLLRGQSRVPGYSHEVGDTYFWNKTKFYRLLQLRDERELRECGAERQLCTGHTNRLAL